MSRTIQKRLYICLIIYRHLINTLFTSQRVSVKAEPRSTIIDHLTDHREVAAVVNKMYSRSVNFKPVPYDQILKADSEMNRVLAQTPDWMRDESIALDPSWPWWVQWQRQAFMVRSLSI